MTSYIPMVESGQIDKHKQRHKDTPQHLNHNIFAVLSFALLVASCGICSRLPSSHLPSPNCYSVHLILLLATIILTILLSLPKTWPTLTPSLRLPRSLLSLPQDVPCFPPRLGNPASVQLNLDIGDTGCIARDGESPDRSAGSAEFTGA